MTRSGAPTRRLDSAHEQYGDEERAHHTAWASVKNVAEKEGDHWELKEGGGTTGGPTKQELYDEARERGIAGRSKMSRDELERAVRDGS